ncbi:MAG: M18 family aminopeptidase [Desulfobulbus sp.]|jgi:aspartyl aminopeptidase|uniref:M18 family aminopeptidase n=1 Tax=Desulfobulbus sp. TaxID=895 RepID=UPI002842D78F|nr:M18 family aminopeptidase [Desulfobulbus sp.]MDR2549991.1 M18 family aminopeptidase [Desulfobulbus sp.]
MQASDYLDDLFTYIDRSPTAYHAVANSAALLQQHGFRRLREADTWGILAPGAYYLTRNDASLIAFTLSHSPQTGTPLRMAGAHTDSPGLKIKPNPLQMRHGCVQIGVEVYGGALLAPWFDRPLSIAGRVSWSGSDGLLRCSLIDCRRPLAIIPSLAIHLDREANDKKSINKQTDLVPVMALSAETVPPDFHTLLRDELAGRHPETAQATILAFDLFLYDTQPLCRVGLQGELIAGSRLDNLLSCHAILQALVQSGTDRNRLVIFNDHEEVGSVSAAGAQGPFLQSVLERLYPDTDLRRQVIAGSLFVSADNAHAVHPNFAAKHDPEHLPRLNGGPVIKANANQRYATDALTGGLFRRFCDKAGVPCQQFVMRNDLACGSTIGPLTAAEIGVATVDVGVPQLAMHSIRETAGYLDGWYLLRALAAFFSAEDQDIRCPEINP